MKSHVDYELYINTLNIFGTHALYLSCQPTKRSTSVLSLYTAALWELLTFLGLPLSAVIPQTLATPGVLNMIYAVFSFVIVTC